LNGLLAGAVDAPPAVGGATGATLICNGIVLPVSGMTGPALSAAVLDPGSVLVVGDTIAAVGPVDVVDADSPLPGPRWSTPPGTP
jgi:hypothetical protein